MSNFLSFLKPKTVKKDYPLFIFFPGMDGTGKLLHTQADSLETYFDLRCLSIANNNFHDWDTLAIQVIDLIEQELKEKKENTVYLCGESFGGCLALKVSSLAPQLCQKLILVNPASSFNQRPLLSFGIPITQWLPDFLHQPSTLGLLPFLASLSRIEQSDRHSLLKIMQSVPSQTVSWRLSLLRDFSLSKEDLNRLTQPTLILASGSDLLLPSIAEARRLSQHLHQAQTIILPDSGHACLIEKDIKLDSILQNYQFLEPSGEEVPTKSEFKGYQDYTIDKTIAHVS